MVQNRNRLNLYYNVGGDAEDIAHEAAYYSRWYWLFIYYMERSKKNHKSLKAELKELEHEIIQNQLIKDLYMPVKWAELLTKSKSKILE